VYKAGLLYTLYGILFKGNYYHREYIRGALVHVRHSPGYADPPLEIPLETLHRKRWFFRETGN